MQLIGQSIDTLSVRAVIHTAFDSDPTATSSDVRGQCAASVPMDNNVFRSGWPNMHALFRESLPPFVTSKRRSLFAHKYERHFAFSPQILRTPCLPVTGQDRLFTLQKGDRQRREKS